jgi:hypothetical protein
MPKHGERWSGHFNEVLNPSQPIAWEDEEQKPKYFAIPTPEAQDEGTQIARRLAAKVKRLNAQQRQAASPRRRPGARYFQIPAQED